MQQGMLYKNEQGLYALDDEKHLKGDEAVEIFDEDLNAWLKGQIKIDDFGEYYFIDEEEFMVVYLYEGLLIRL